LTTTQHQDKAKEARKPPVINTTHKWLKKRQNYN
jgi:hypothetical protein